MNYFLAAISGDALIHQLFVLFILGVVLGLVYYGVSKAPFIVGVIKTFLMWVCIAIGVFLVINFLLSLIGHEIIRL